MSNAGPPSDPQPDPPDRDESGSPDDASGQTPAEKPYNPYPDNWDAPRGWSAPPGPGEPPNPYGQPDRDAPVQPYGPPNPYAEQNLYGEGSPYRQPSPYGDTGAPANPYGAPAGNRPTFGFGGYAGWVTRVGAYLIDGVLGAIAGLPLWIGYVRLFAGATTRTDANGVKHLEVHPSGSITALIWIGILTSAAFQIWNVYIRQGRTGATYGKSVLAIRLVNAQYQPIGPGWAFVRQLVHILDSLPCGLGWLWPIWDSRKQTFADKIMNTFVINATVAQPPLYPGQPYPPQSYPPHSS